ncbi:spore coat protein U domain-containing protein, partial [Klebsiella quasipneumoniae]
DTTEVQSQISTTGSAQSLVVYGAIPVQNWPKLGDYQDTVVVTLSY